MPNTLHHYHIVRIWPTTGELDIACVDHVPQRGEIELNAPLYFVAAPIPRVEYDDCVIRSQQLVHRLSFSNVSEQINKEARTIVDGIVNDLSHSLVEKHAFTRSTPEIAIQDLPHAPQE